jgi:hypothetical protein
MKALRALSQAGHQGDAPVVVGCMSIVVGNAGASKGLREQLRVGHVEANDIEAIVLSGGDEPLRDGIDGLLERSFLLRFDVTCPSRPVLPSQPSPLRRDGHCTTKQLSWSVRRPCR